MTPIATKAINSKAATIGIRSAATLKADDAPSSAVLRTGAAIPSDIALAATRPVATISEP